jgi:SET domain-containing protein 6
VDMADFKTTTTTFLAWLSQMGIQVNPKMALVDLRAENKGRGVGEYPIILQVSNCVPGFAYYQDIFDRPMSCLNFVPLPQHADISILVAVADIDENEILFTIPRSSVLNTSTALDDSYPAFLRQALLEMPSWLVF